VRKSHRFRRRREGHAAVSSASRSRIVATRSAFRLDGVIHCNCQPSNPDLEVNDGKATCEACGKQFALLFNPTNSRLELRVGVPEKPEVPA
jgi:hypothetical protein